MSGRKNRKQRRAELPEKLGIKIDASRYFKPKTSNGYGLVFFDGKGSVVMKNFLPGYNLGADFIIEKCIDCIGERVKDILRRTKEGFQDFPGLLN